VNVLKRENKRLREQLNTKFKDTEETDLMRELENEKRLTKTLRDYIASFEEQTAKPKNQGFDISPKVTVRRKRRNMDLETDSVDSLITK